MVDVCKKYSIDRSSKEVSKAAWSLNLAPEEWSFLRRVNWSVEQLNTCGHFHFHQVLYVCLKIKLASLVQSPQGRIFYLDLQLPQTGRS